MIYIFYHIHNSFFRLDYDVLAAVISSDELNSSEECVFESCMNWIAA